MKIFRIVLIFSILLFGIFFTSLTSQEMSAFELKDNLSVGLTVSPSSKWGIAISDIDRNGYPDIYQARSASPGYSRIYVNNNGFFQDISDQSPLEQIEENTNENETKSAAWIDFDNDGDRDLYFGTNENIHLLRNDNNTFVDIAESIGLVGGVPGFVIEYEYANGAWGDFDLDGDLDVLIAQHNNEKPYFFRNDNGVFVDIQAETGIVIDIGYNSYGVQWIDFDLDGDLDLCARKLIFRNDNGLFTEISESIGFTPSDIQNCTWFDFDTDGDLDFFHSVSSASGPAACELWENQGGTFVDISADVFAIPLVDRFRGMSVGDFDNDGDEDIFLNINEDTYDVLLLNEEVEPGVRVLEDVAEFIGITQLGDRKGGSFFDYDRDGFLDLYLTSAEHSHILYHNITNNSNWIGFILEGVESNRDAIGTLVKVVSSEKSQIRFTRVPTDYQNQDNPWVHFGLGQAESVDSVIIKWPLGLEEVFTDVAINQYHEIKEGQSTADVNNSGKNQKLPDGWQLTQNYPNPFNALTKISYHLQNNSVVNLQIFDMTGRKVKTLINTMSKAGIFDVTWNGTNQSGRTVPSGIYFCRIQTEKFSKTIKMILSN
jgi:enediyne biosynthesis protein E4